MHVQFHEGQTSSYSAHEAKYVSPAQTFLSRREYEVHALSVYDGIVFVLVVDDKQTPIFLPRVLFETVEASIPDDWICTVFSEGPVQMVVGPPFIARDLKTYNAMIDQERTQVDSFWARLDARNQEES